MQVTVTGKQLDIGEGFRDHARSRLAEAVAKYFDHAIEASVVLSRESHHLCCDISVHVGRGILVQGRGQGDGAQTAFDSAAERIAKRLRRYKRRLRDHHREAHLADVVERTVAQRYVLAAPPDETDGGEAAETNDDQPVVIAEMATAIDRLTVGEAVMRMELADHEALMFRNAAHGGLNVVYRRSDGNFGWIDPAGNADGDTV